MTEAEFKQIVREYDLELHENVSGFTEHVCYLKNNLDRHNTILCKFRRYENTAEFSRHVEVYWYMQRREDAKTYAMYFADKDSTHSIPIFRAALDKLFERIEECRKEITRKKIVNICKEDL